MGKFVVPNLTGSGDDATVVVGFNTDQCSGKDVSLETGALFGAKGDGRHCASKVVWILHMFVTYFIAVYLLMYSRGWVYPR